MEDSIAVVQGHAEYFLPRSEQYSIRRLCDPLDDVGAQHFMDYDL